MNGVHVIVPQSVDLSGVSEVRCNTVTAAWLRTSSEFTRAMKEHQIGAEHDGFMPTGRAQLFAKGGLLIGVLQLTPESAKRLMVTFNRKSKR